MGVLTEDADPMVSVMKLEKAPNETYADIGGLDQQIQEIKVHRSLCLYTIEHLVVKKGLVGWYILRTSHVAVLLFHLHTASADTLGHA